MAPAVMVTDAHLCALLKTARRAARLSQLEAAQRANRSRTWWRRVESGPRAVGEETLLDMLAAVSVCPEHLDAAGHPRLATLLRKRREFESHAATAQDLERYLATAPAPEATRRALIITARAVEEFSLTLTAPGHQVAEVVNA
jgi:transcriptional regulator with XRE-family HTH domain